MWENNSWPNDPQAWFLNNMSLYLRPLNDDVSSVVNHGYCQGTGSSVRFYEHSSYNGSSFVMYCLESGLQMRDPNLSNGTNATSVNWDNRISSATFF